MKVVQGQGEGQGEGERLIIAFIHILELSYNRLEFIFRS